MSDKIIVTGGSIASMMLGERVNDFDVYFTEHDAVLKAVLYYVERYTKCPSKRYVGKVPCGISVKDKDGWERIYWDKKSENSLTANQIFWMIKESRRVESTDYATIVAAFEFKRELSIAADKSPKFDDLIDTADAMNESELKNEAITSFEEMKRVLVSIGKWK